MNNLLNLDILGFDTKGIVWLMIVIIAGIMLSIHYRKREPEEDNISPEEDLGDDYEPTADEERAGEEQAKLLYGAKEPIKPDEDDEFIKSYYKSGTVKDIKQ